MHRLEFFFDCSSPWTYLAFEGVQQLVASGKVKVEIEWRPFLVGGVFNTVNPSVYANRENPIPAKQAYYAKDLQDWADDTGIKIGMPPVFPVNSVKVMRGAFVAIEEGLLIPYAKAAFHSYWGDLNDISEDDEVTAIATAAGLDVKAFWDKITSTPYKQKLRDNTAELVERGGFGSPTMYLDGDDMYFGNDRLPLIFAKLGL